MDPQLLAQARLKENSLAEEVDFVLVALLQLPQENYDCWTEFPVKIPLHRGYHSFLGYDPSVPS